MATQMAEHPMESLRIWLRSGNPAEDCSRRRSTRGIAAFLVDPRATPVGLTEVSGGRKVGPFS